MQGWTVPAQTTQPGPPVANAAPQAKALTPADLSKVLFKRKWIILILALVGTGIGIYHAETTTPLYEATCQIYIDLGSSPNLGIGGLVQQQYMYDEPAAMLQTQAQIMRSN